MKVVFTLAPVLEVTNPSIYPNFVGAPKLHILHLVLFNAAVITSVEHFKRI